MHWFPDEPALQSTALMALGNILQGNPRAQQVAVDRGGARAVLTAMAASPYSESIQQYGCHALAGLLSAGESPEEQRDRQDEVGGAGGVGAIVSAMQEHDRWMVQQFCCGALRQLVAVDANRANRGFTHTGAFLCLSLLLYVSLSLTLFVSLSLAAHGTAAVAAGALKAAEAAARKHRHATDCAKVAEELSLVARQDL